MTQGSVLPNLPDDILDILLKQQWEEEGQGQLHLCNKRLWSIFDEWRRRVFRHKYGAMGMELAYKVAREINCRLVLGNDPSWYLMEKFFAYDWCFWQQCHIAAAEPHEVTDVGDDLTGVASGVWRAITGPLKGVHASNVHLLQLKYHTRLFPGEYRVVISLRVPNIARLVSVKFRVFGEQVLQHWKQFPPHALPAEDQEAENRYLRFESCSICAGEMTVGGDALTDITFEIEEMGQLMKRGMLFNHVSFEKISSRNDEEWRLVNEPRLSLLDVKQSFEAFTRLKLET